MKQIITFLAIIIFSNSYSQDLATYMKKYLDEGNKEKIKEIIDLGFNPTKDIVFGEENIKVENLGTIKKVCRTYTYNHLYQTYTGKDEITGYKHSFMKTEALNVPQYLYYKSDKKNRLSILSWLISSNYVSSNDLKSVKRDLMQTITLQDVPIKCRDKYKKGEDIEKETLKTTSTSVFQIALQTKSEGLIDMILEYKIPYNSNEINEIVYSKDNFKFIEFLKNKNFTVNDAEYSKIQTQYNAATEKQNKEQEELTIFNLVDTNINEAISKINQDNITVPILNKIIDKYDINTISKIIDLKPILLNQISNSSFYSTNKNLEYYAKYNSLSFALKNSDKEKFDFLISKGADPTKSGVTNLSKKTEMQEVFDFAKIKFKNQVINDYENAVQNNEGSIKQNEERGKLKYVTLYYKCEQFKGFNEEATKCMAQKFGKSISNLDYVFATGDRRLKKYPKKEIFSFIISYVIDNKGKLSVKSLTSSSISQQNYENVVKDKIEQYFNRLNSSEQKIFTSAIDTNGNFISQVYKQKIQAIIKLTY